MGKRSGLGPLVVLLSIPASLQAQATLTGTVRVDSTKTARRRRRDPDPGSQQESHDGHGRAASSWMVWPTASTAWWCARSGTVRSRSALTWSQRHARRNPAHSQVPGRACTTGSHGIGHSAWVGRLRAPAARRLGVVCRLDYAQERGIPAGERHRPRHEWRACPIRRAGPGLHDRLAPTVRWRSIWTVSPSSRVRWGGPRRSMIGTSRTSMPSRPIVALLSTPSEFGGIFVRPAARCCSGADATSREISRSRGSPPRTLRAGSIAKRRQTGRRTSRSAD